MEQLRRPAVQFSILAVGLLVLLALMVRWFLSGSGFPPPEDLAATALSDQDENDREAAAELLARHPDDPLTLLRKVVAESESARVRAAAALGLGRLHDWESIPLLIEGLESDSVFLRERSVAALRQILSRDFGYRPRADEPERRQAIETIKECWPIHHQLHLKKQQVMGGKQS